MGIPNLGMTFERSTLSLPDDAFTGTEVPEGRPKTRPFCIVCPVTKARGRRGSILGMAADPSGIRLWERAERHCAGSLLLERYPA